MSRLEAAGIPYMLTGSMAANFYATPWMTRDIDVVIELQEAEVERVVTIFQDEYYVDRDMVEQAVKSRSMFSIIHNALVVKVDCVARKDSEHRREEFARRRRLTIDGELVTIVAPEDLILSKLEWAKESHSQLQLDDVRNLLRSVKDLDRTYLNQWVDRLGLAAVYREVQS